MKGRGGQREIARGWETPGFSIVRMPEKNKRQSGEEPKTLQGRMCTSVSLASSRILRPRKTQKRDERLSRLNEVVRKTGPTLGGGKKGRSVHQRKRCFVGKFLR